MITAFHHSSLSFAVLSNLVYFDPALPRSPAESQTSTSNVRTSAMFFSSAIHFPIPPLVHPLHPSISQHLKQPQNSINLPFTMSTVDRVNRAALRFHNQEPASQAHFPWRQCGLVHPSTRLLAHVGPRCILLRRGCARGTVHLLVLPLYIILGRGWGMGDDTCLLVETREKIKSSL